MLHTFLADDRDARASRGPAGTHRLPAFGDQPVEGHGVGVPDAAQRRGRCRRILPVAQPERARRAPGRGHRPLHGHERPLRHRRRRPGARPRRRRRRASTRSPAWSISASTPTWYGAALPRSRRSSSASRLISAPARSIRAICRSAVLIHAEQATHLQCTPSMLAMLVADPTDGAALGKLDHVAHRWRSVHAGARRRSADAAQRPAHQHVRPDRDDRVVARARGRAIRRDPHRSPHRQHHRARRRSDRRADSGRRGGRAADRRRRRHSRLPRSRRAHRGALHRPSAMGPRLRDRRPRDDPDTTVSSSSAADSTIRSRCAGTASSWARSKSALEDEPQVARAVVVAVDVDSVTELVAFITPKDAPTLRSRARATRARGATARADDPARASRSATRCRRCPTARPIGSPSRRPRPRSSLDPCRRRSTASRRPSPTRTSARGRSRDASGSAADEAAVIEIWSTVLGRPIQRDDNFFEVGGHSLLAVKVFRLLERASRRAAGADRHLPLPQRPSPRRPHRCASRADPAQPTATSRQCTRGRRPRPRATIGERGGATRCSAAVETADDDRLPRHRSRHRRHGRPLPRRRRCRRVLGAHRARRRLPRRSLRSRPRRARCAGAQSA